MNESYYLVQPILISHSHHVSIVRNFSTFGFLWFQRKLLLQQVFNVTDWLRFTLQYIYVLQFTVETYCFAGGRGLFKHPRSVIYHWNQCYEEISKKCRSVRPFVTLTKKACSSIINSRIIIRISDERTWHLLQENEAIVSKNFIFQKFQLKFSKNQVCA